MAKPKALISFAVTAKLICAFVFAYAKCWFSHDVAHITGQNTWSNWSKTPRTDPEVIAEEIRCVFDDI